MFINFHTLKISHLIIAITIATIFSGCGSKKLSQPQQLALHTWQSLIHYETKLTNKIDAENAFYQTQLLNFRRGLTGFTNLSELSNTENEEDKDKNIIENSLIYGRIYTNAQRDALIIADSLFHASSPKITTAIIQMIDKGISEDISHYKLLGKRDKELSENLLSNLVKLNQEKIKLKQVRDNLARLSKDPGLDEKLGILVEHVQVIAKELENSQTDQ